MVLAGVEGDGPAPDSLRIITPDFQVRPIPDLSTVEGQRLIEPHLGRIDLLVLDNLSALCRYGNENEGESWLPVQEWGLRSGVAESPFSSSITPARTDHSEALLGAKICWIRFLP